MGQKRVIPKGEQPQQQPRSNGEGRQLATVQEKVGLARRMLNDNIREIEKALAKQLDPDQFLRICLTTYQRGGDNMLKADPRSFVAACVEAAQLGLKVDPILGEAYLIPRYDRDAKGFLVNMQLGYRGLMKLARRSGAIVELAAEVVTKHDRFHVVLGTERRIEHVPWYSNGADEPGDTVAAYATARLQDGTVAFKVVARRELEAAAERSGDPRDKKWSNVWQQHFDPMAMKTAMTRLCKWLPLSDFAAHVVNRDEQRESGIVDDGLRDMIESIVVERTMKVTQEKPAGPPSSLDDLVHANRRSDDGGDEPGDEDDAEREPGEDEPDDGSDA